jgi:hypothetical protein
MNKTSTTFFYLNQTLQKFNKPLAKPNFDIYFKS